MRCAIATDIGLLREENQDIVRAEKFGEDILAVICDGMGGERSGLEASEKAVSVFFEHFNNNIGVEMRTVDEIRKLLIQSVSAANSVVYSLSRMNYRSYGMGTTCVAAYVRENDISIVNVGDSRAYYYNNGRLLLLTHDHTYVNLLLDEGRITKEELENNPQKHMLTKAVGVSRTIEPDYIHLKHEYGSKLLLCSDGLSGYCRASEIAKILGSEDDTQRCVKKLVHLALDKGGRDNISVAVVE